MKKKWLKYLFVIIFVILLDQASKCGLLHLITGGAPLTGHYWDVVANPYIITPVTSFFNIVFTWNPGASFSLFRALGNAAPLIMVVLTGAIIGALGHYMFARAKKSERIPLALILGGALGNLIDRIRFGAVVDFLDFHIGDLHWPAFNVADICICLGVGLYIINWLIVARKTKGKK